jgi:Na+/proline symporter
MTNYTIQLVEGIKVIENVSAQVIRNPNVTIALIWLMLFVLIFLTFIHVFQKLLESLIENKKSRIIKRYVIVLTILFIFLFILVKIAITYPSINLLKPIADWFGIPYK